MKLFYWLMPLVIIFTVSGCTHGANQRNSSIDNSTIKPEEPLDAYHGRDGAQEAIRDLQHKCARYCIYGRSAGRPILPEWNALAKERFDINVEAIAGCLISDELVKYANEYNRILFDYVAKTFGPDAWQACEIDAAKMSKSASKKPAEGRADYPN